MLRSQTIPRALRVIGSDKLRRAYAFLCEVEREQRSFTREELVQASGWTEKTTTANLSKKLNQIVRKGAEGYHCIGALAMDEEAFCRMCSQNVALASDPQRPLLPDRVADLVEKARDAALAAVQHYNNPSALFRSGNYIVLMIIGYTALFHAIFERDSVDYIERNNDRTPRLTRDGRPYLWDALVSARYYAQHYVERYEQGVLMSMAKNVEFIFSLRNDIEHRYMPELDSDICGHCQAMLINFEQILTTEFTHYYALNPSLSIALQFSTQRSPRTVAALKRLQSAEYAELRKYISTFHASLPNEIASSSAFEFRVWLIQKPANRERSADLAIEFVRTDQLTEEQRQAIEQAIVAIKPQFIDYSKECNLWEKDVLAQVQQRIGDIVQFGEQTKPLTNTMIRWVRDAHNITSPSKFYYRPGRDGSRAMYGPAFVSWIVEKYTADANFFFKAKPKKALAR